MGVITLGGDGPLGLEIGMSLEEVAAVLGEMPRPYSRGEFEGPVYLYQVSPLRDYPEFNVLFLKITPNAGLCECYLQTRPPVWGGAVPGNPDGLFFDRLETRYDQLCDQLTAEYDLPIITTNYPSPNPSLTERPRKEVTAHWKPEKEGIKLVTLYWNTLTDPVSMKIYYQFDNIDKAREEIAKAGESSHGKSLP